MKKIAFLIVVCLSFVLNVNAQSKIIYSNPMTHCYITAFVVDDSVMYQVSETSDRKVWRFTDRTETQVLGLFDAETILKIFESANTLFENKELNKTIQINDVILTYKRVLGVKCVNFKHSLIGVDFNINQKTAKDIIDIFSKK